MSQSSLPAPVSPRRLKVDVSFTQSYVVKNPQRHRVTKDAREALKTFMLKRQAAFGIRAAASSGYPDSEVRRPAAANAMPEELVFYSWWNEEVATPQELQRSGDSMGVRKHLRLQYHVSDGVFQLFLDDRRTPLTLAIEHTDGTPLLPRELFVGAEIDVLGRHLRRDTFFTAWCAFL